MDFEAGARRLREAHRELHASLGRSKRDSEFQARWTRGLERGQSPGELFRDLLPPEDVRNLGQLKEGPRYKAAVQEFWDAHGALYRAVWAAVAEVSGGSAHAVDLLVDFLEADVWCYRSGYEKGNTARALRRVTLSEFQARRVQMAILKAIQKGPREEIGEFAKLARRVDNAPFRAELEGVIEAGDSSSALRAERLLAKCQLNDHRTGDWGAR